MLRTRSSDARDIFPEAGMIAAAEVNEERFHGSS